MTFEEWRKTRVWHDQLALTGITNKPGFIYDDGSYIEFNVIWHAHVATKEYSNYYLQPIEYSLWNNHAKFNYDTMQDECTITWTETITYKVTAALTRGADDEDAFEEMMQLIVNDEDIDKEELNVTEPVLESVEWQ